MYFNDKSLFNFKEIVKNPEVLYAHLDRERKEKLSEHMELTYKYFLKINREKNLNIVFKNLEDKLLKNYSESTRKIWRELIANAIYMHDLGKINSDFQYLKMKNEIFKNTINEDSKHSMLSSCFYFSYYYEKLRDRCDNERKILSMFMVINTYLISKHHGSLDEFSSFREKFQDKYKKYIDKKCLYESYKGELLVIKIDSFFKAINKVMESVNKEEAETSIAIFIYSKLLFSLLTASDFYATSEFMNEKAIEEFGTIKDISIFTKGYRASNIQKTILNYRNYKNGDGANPFELKDINQLRTELFLEAEENLLSNIDSKLFYLEAPTGGGKTNISINLALKILEQDNSINKIFYIFPFNTLVEQTYKALIKSFNEDEDIKKNIAVINSITPIIIEEEMDEKDYAKAVLDREFLHYPIVITTHVNLFNYLFGTNKELNFPLCQLANSVIILDEIQSYKNSIWREIAEFLKTYAETLNIKVLIMSATLPKLGDITEEGNQFRSLIENREKYYQNPLFKNRVQADYSLLDILENVEDKLFEKVIEVSINSDKNILVEFINKKRAFNFYKKLCDKSNENEFGKKILLITGDDNKIERTKIIQQVNNEKNIILVSTQVIEAGVDIDMDIGFKDISILDAEEQFLGRINRSCKKEGCLVYFFNIDEANKIYKNDHRKKSELTIKNNEIREILDSKNFYFYYQKVLGFIKKDNERQNEGNIQFFLRDILGKLHFSEVEKRMKLIEDDRNIFTVFLNRDIKLESGELVNGNEVWQQYRSVLLDKHMSYAERRVKLSEVLERVDYFTYKVNKVGISFEDRLGYTYYIEDGWEYFTDGKFDREKLTGSTWEMV